MSGSSQQPTRAPWSEAERAVARAKLEEHRRAWDDFGLQHGRAARDHDAAALRRLKTNAEILALRHAEERRLYRLDELASPQRDFPEGAERDRLIANYMEALESMARKRGLTPATDDAAPPSPSPSPTPAAGPAPGSAAAAAPSSPLAAWPPSPSPAAAAPPALSASPPTAATEPAQASPVQPRPAAPIQTEATVGSQARDALSSAPALAPPAAPAIAAAAQTASALPPAADADAAPAPSAPSRAPPSELAPVAPASAGSGGPRTGFARSRAWPASAGWGAGDKHRKISEKLRQREAFAKRSHGPAVSDNLLWRAERVSKTRQRGSVQGRPKRCARPHPRRSLIASPF